MARTVSLPISAQHSADLQGVIENRARPVNHVQRAQMILMSAERLPVLEIAKRPSGVALAAALRRGSGLLRDKTRPPGISPVPQDKVRAVVERTLRDPVQSPVGPAAPWQRRWVFGPALGKWRALLKERRAFHGQAAATVREGICSRGRSVG